MMIKVFTKDENGKISLTPDELKSLLDEAYWEGYKANNTSWTYTTPSWEPYRWTVTTDTITLTGSDCASNSTITVGTNK